MAHSRRSPLIVPRCVQVKLRCDRMADAARDVANGQERHSAIRALFRAGAEHADGRTETVNALPKRGRAKSPAVRRVEARHRR